MGADYIHPTVQDHSSKSGSWKYQSPGSRTRTYARYIGPSATLSNYRHHRGRSLSRSQLEEADPRPHTYKAYQATLRIFAEKAGMDPASVSSHSLRRGGCTFLSLCGVMIEELRTRGDWCTDWCTDTVFTYLKTHLSIRIMNDMHVATNLSATLYDN